MTSRQSTWLLLGLVAVIGIMVLMPETSFAQYLGGGSQLENKVGGITKGLVNFLLPAVSCLGLVYASILAAQGDAEAKSRMVMIVVACIVGFLAPLVIRWLQTLAGGSF